MTPAMWAIASVISSIVLAFLWIALWRASEVRVEPTDSGWRDRAGADFA